MKRLKHILNGIKGASIVLLFFLLFPVARLFLWHRKIWIVSEFGYEARDNGFSFYKYMRKKHPEINCYYAIDFKSSDYPKIEKFGNCIKFGSFKHFAYWCAARYIISSKTQGFCPNYYLTLLRKKFHLCGKYIFLQHGITKDDQKFLYKKVAKIDLFICGARPEFEDIKTHYGYNRDEVVYTGFARFDDYLRIVPKKQILVMPTWRRYAEKVDFVNTDYYKTWYSFVNSSELNRILEQHSLSLYFYLHPHFKDYFGLFDTQCSNIKLISFNDSDFQNLVRESILFVTDFSSLAFDFGYMGRPVIYYQYDEKDYFEKHYIKGYFDYRRDGFGDVVDTFDSLLKSLINIINNNFEVDDRVADNAKRFFPIRDNKNSERIFNAIVEL